MCNQKICNANKQTNKKFRQSSMIQIKPSNPARPKFVLCCHLPQGMGSTLKCDLYASETSLEKTNFSLVGVVSCKSFWVWDGGLCPLSLSDLELHLVDTCSGPMPAATVTVSAHGHQSWCVKKVLCPWCPLSPLILTFSLCLFFGSVPWVPREGFDGNIPFRTEWSAVSHSLSDYMTDWEYMTVGQISVFLLAHKCISGCSSSDFEVCQQLFHTGNIYFLSFTNLLSLAQSAIQFTYLYFWDLL